MWLDPQPIYVIMRTQDGFASVSPIREIRVPNGTLTDNGNGSVSLVFSTLPDQTGQAGKFLKTDGAVASWAAVPNPDLSPYALLVGAAFTGSVSTTGDMTANRVLIGNGSSGSPSLAFAAATGTGLYRESSTVVNHVVNGTIRLSLYGSEVHFNGTDGIGWGSGAANLPADILISRTSGGNGLSLTNTANDLLDITFNASVTGANLRYENRGGQQIDGGLPELQFGSTSSGSPLRVNRDRVQITGNNGTTKTALIVINNVASSTVPTLIVRGGAIPASGGHIASFQTSVAEVFAIGGTGNLRTNQSTVGLTTPGTVIGKMPFYDISGALIGYAPIYDNVT